MKSRCTTGKYQVHKLKSGDIDSNLWTWFMECGHKLNFLYDINYDFSTFDCRYHADVNHLWLCTRNGEPVGFLLASNTNSFFDSSFKSLTQRVFFALPNSRAAYHLMKEYIDFGKKNNKSIHTVIGLVTNIKSSTLKRMGFKYVESLFRLEV